MNITIKVPQKSRVSQNTTGLSDNTITSPIEVGISKILANFGNLSQNSLNFAARVGFYPAQKSDTHQKTTATKARRGFVNFI